ncbi:MAG: outer membrane protein assembly factor BamA [Candidatus Omnitrophota bacterium]|nr:outer membrane protein assembly factor BamA [Candidatus Omnitrophota bacterium]MBU1929780.1 outer membrane protein assembly factor BamA [Candidatus Omnitrophota bacterium]MBU2035218.1 outer membrane protein assembly factor BamA [Candidatus Omnitrophota bacterium]MBU2221861.1 outer membrane protein assembly factor BamA [Candidatus Omnitrophota bacterium]MBU2257808.1 outer membrane protein assembly factor BamA [Candidatus Omnitrophota bacterium]
MKKTGLVIFTFLFLYLSLNTVVLAQDQADTNQSAGVAPDVIYPAVKSVTAIDIKGNKSISTNTIFSKMKTRIGNPYQDNITSDDLKRLYLLGFFSDIKIDTEDYKGGVKIVITVTERPIIEKIVLSGISRLNSSEDKIKGELKSKETQYLDYPTLDEDVQTLKKFYEKKGFGQVQAQYKADVDSLTNKAKVEFIIDEGKKIKIRNITVEGNKSFKSGRILKVIKTKKAWFFGAGVFKEDVFKEDIERLKSFYKRNGYADVIVDYEIRNDPKRPFLFIDLKIQEGKKYTVGTISIRGNKDIIEKNILERLKECTTGKVFSQEALKQDLSGIQGLYFDRGYISMQIQETTYLNPATERIDIVYNIVENQVAYVNKVRIRGNIKTKEVVIRREMRLRPGDKFDGDKLRRSKDRLQNLGFFEDISYDTEDTQVPNRKDLIVDVKESKTGAFSFGGGYSSVEQFVGFAEVEQKNFDWRNFPYFTGAGQNLKFRVSAGSVSNGYELSFTEPWMFDYPVSFGFDIYRRTHKRESDTGYGYDEDVTGGDLRLGKEISEYVKTSLVYRYDSIKIGNISSNASSDLASEYGTNVISSLRYGLTYDNRNNVFDPVKGDILDGSFELAGGPFGGDKEFYKFYGQAAHYWPITKGSTLLFKGRLGWAEPYGNSDKVSIYERFFAGGAYTVRGYNERKVGPVDPSSGDPLGGESVMIGNIEYIFPIAGYLKLAAFYDTGNVWSKASKIGTGGFKSGYGLGFRLKTPIGPLMLDYGIPLNKESGEDSVGDGKIHFSMSHGF